jgi:ketosteroid isomerase-like protein
VSEDNVEILCAAIEAFARRDLPGLLRYADPEIEFEPQLAALEGSYSGHDGVRRFFADSWDDLELASLEYPDVRDLDDRVLALGTFHISGKGSGIPAEPPMAIVATIRDGLITHLKDYGGHAKALEAAGLRDQVASARRQGREHRFRGAVETPGIEPGSAVARKVASTSVAGALVSSSGCRAGGVPEDQLPEGVPGLAGAIRPG